MARGIRACAYQIMDVQHRLDRRVIAVVTLVALGASCGTSKIYGYERTRKREFPDVFDPSPLTNAARAALAAAKKVAYFPPDWCDQNITARQTDTIVDSRVMRMHCGVLLASLERSAEAAGYDVVSWQTLRGSSRPIEYARSSGVDVLFEINEFDLVTLWARDARTNLTFFEEQNDGRRVPLTVNPEVGDRCLAYSRRGEENTALGLSGTIDIKMVSVADGANLWHYRRTEGIDFKVPDPPVRFRAKAQSRPFAWAGLIVGAGMTIGAISACSDHCSSDDEGAATRIGLAGALFAAVSVYRLASRPSESPEAVLCQKRPIREPMKLQPQAPEQASSSFTYGVHVDETDATEEARKRVQGVIIKEFLDTLADVRRFVPALPAAPAPAPPSPAPPAAPPPAPAPDAGSPAGH
jgi:hypothetical protein